MPQEDQPEGLARGADRARRARPLAVEALGLSGVASVLAGVAMIYPPAALILGGLAAVAAAVAISAGVFAAGDAD